MNDHLRLNVPLYQVRAPIPMLPLQQMYQRFPQPSYYKYVVPPVFYTGNFYHQMRAPYYTGQFLYHTNNVQGNRQPVQFANVPILHYPFQYHQQMENNIKPTKNISIDYGLYKRIILASCNSEYQKVENTFMSTNKKYFNVDIIEKVENPNLLKKYEQRKKQYESIYGHVEEKELFHGTKRRNLNDICLKNFNWRLGGTVTGHLYGHGISFTPDAYYATHYGDKTESRKVMILAKVLVSNHCVGNKDTKIPPRGYDTTTKEDGKVFVKYEDSCYYPAYIIYYSRCDVYKVI